MNCLITTSGFEVAFFLFLAKENLEDILDYIVKRQGQEVARDALNI